MKSPSPSPIRSSDVILGIDPGTLVVGYGAVRMTSAGPVFISAGVLRPRRSASVPERLGEIGAGLDESDCFFDHRLGCLRWRES